MYLFIINDLFYKEGTMKKFLTLLAVLGLAVSLPACSKKDKAGKTSMSKKDKNGKDMKKDKKSKKAKKGSQKHHGKKADAVQAVSKY